MSAPAGTWLRGPTERRCLAGPRLIKADAKPRCDRAAYLAAAGALARVAIATGRDRYLASLLFGVGTMDLRGRSLPLHNHVGHAGSGAVFSCLVAQRGQVESGE